MLARLFPLVAFASIASIVSACGSSAPPPTTPEAARSAATSESRAEAGQQRPLSELLGTALNAEVDVLAHGRLGQQTWAVFEVNGTALWLGAQANRDEMLSAIEGCECFKRANGLVEGADEAEAAIAPECVRHQAALEQSEDTDEPTPWGEVVAHRGCEDTALWRWREPLLREQHHSECMARAESMRAEDCEEMFPDEVLHDRSAYYNELHIALLNTGSGALLSRQRLARFSGGLRSVRTQDVDGDDELELFVDHIASSIGAFELIVSENKRQLALLRVSASGLSLLSSTPLGWYVADVGASRALCNYTLEREPTRISRTCCMPPSEDDMSPEADAYWEEEQDALLDENGERVFPELDADGAASCVNLQNVDFAFGRERGFVAPGLARPAP